MTFLFECIVACVLFTALVEFMLARSPRAFANDYPPFVAESLRRRGLIAQKPPLKSSDIVRKAVFMAASAALGALVVRYVNGATTFFEAAAIAYGVWFVVDWYDFLVPDVLLARFDRFYKAAGASPFDRRSVAFHARKSLVGMVLGTPFALVVGMVAALL